MYAQVLEAIKNGAHIIELQEDVESGKVALTSIPGYTYNLRVLGYDVVQTAPYKEHIATRKDGSKFTRKIGMTIFYNGKTIPIENRPKPGARSVSVDEGIDGVSN